MAASGVLAVVAKSQFSAGESEAAPARNSDSVHAGQLADVATVVLAAGGAATGIGLIVWLTAPRASVAVGASGPTLFVSGAF